MAFGENDTEHLQAQPDWDCRVCHRPWPCAIAKSALLAEFALFPSVLTIFMSGKMHDAASDLTSDGEPVPKDLYERFLSWVQSARAKPYANQGHHYSAT